MQTMNKKQLRDIVREAVQSRIAAFLIEERERRMILSKQRLQEMINEEFAIASLKKLREEVGLGSSLYNAQASELIGFAHAWSNLDESERAQLDALVHGDSDVDEETLYGIHEALYGVNGQIDSALDDYIDNSLSSEK